VKILFQTSNADFKQYAGEPSGSYLPVPVPRFELPVCGTRVTSVI
jgi:hypothetical protein